MISLVFTFFQSRPSYKKDLVEDQFGSVVSTSEGDKKKGGGIEKAQGCNIRKTRIDNLDRHSKMIVTRRFMLRIFS